MRASTLLWAKREFDEDISLKNLPSLARFFSPPLWWGVKCLCNQVLNVSDWAKASTWPQLITASSWIFLGENTVIPLLPSSQYHASIQDIFHRRSAKLHNQRYSRIKVSDSLMRRSLNLRLLMILLILFFLESFVDVKVRGWLKLTSKQREQCITKLRYRSPRIHVCTAWSY